MAPNQHTESVISAFIGRHHGLVVSFYMQLFYYNRNKMVSVTSFL